MPFSWGLSPPPFVNLVVSFLRGLCPFQTPSWIAPRGESYVCCSSDTSVAFQTFGIVWTRFFRMILRFRWIWVEGECFPGMLCRGLFPDGLCRRIMYSEHFGSWNNVSANSWDHKMGGALNSKLNFGWPPQKILWSLNNSNLANSCYSHIRKALPCLSKRRWRPRIRKMGMEWSKFYGKIIQPKCICFL